MQSIVCETEAEQDSINCALNPTAEGCVQEQDTTLYACSESITDGVATSTLYRLSCTAANGVVTSCNGKTNVNISTDGTPIKTMQGTCNENGYQNGITGGGSDSTGSTASCFAAIGANCVMKDKRSGNTFDCPCDGSCDYALRKMATGECVNPYPQEPPQNGDSIELPPTSYEPPVWNSSSSPSEPPPSFGEDLSALNGLYGVVDTIRDTLNKAVVPSLRMIQANTQQSNEYLQQIAAKEWSVNVDVSAPNVNVENNTDVSGIQSRQDRQYDSDTAYQSRVLGAIGALSDTSGAGNPNDTAGSGAALDSRLSLIDSAVGAYDVPDMSDSIAPTLEAIRGDIRAYRDSIEGGAMGDSVDAWSRAFTDNGVLTGSGSNSCPEPLTRNVSYTFPHVGTIQAGSLGTYLCTPIVGGVTLWSVARLMLRAFAAIACMWWLFREVTGTSGGQSDDD